MVPSKRLRGAEQGDSARSRGQTATIGLVLVFGMVIAGAALVVALGSTAVNDTQALLTEQRAQKVMTQFDSKAALVALGNAETQQIEFPRRGSERVRIEETAGKMTINIDNLHGGTSRSKTWDLGTMIYEREDMEIAYQGGGVWRKVPDSRESVMVSPPEFHFRGGTLTLPIIRVSGDSSVGSRATVTAGASAETWFPDTANGWPNPLGDHKVTVTVESRYYRGWGNYFETRTDGSVSYDHANDEVTIELLTPIGNRQVNSASASLSPAGSFKIDGSAADPCGIDSVYADSFNSEGTTDDYCAQKSAGNTGDRGNITYGDEIDIDQGSGGSEIVGSIRSGGSVWVSDSGAGKPDVAGDIYWTSACNGDCDAVASGDVQQISGVPDVSDISRHVQVTVDDKQSDNDNGDAGVPIASDQIQYTSDTATLEAGTYYLNHIDVADGETLTLDASTGSITIAVKDYVDVKGELKVTGDKVARVYIKGENTMPSNSKHLRAYGSGDCGCINVENDDSPKLRFYGQSDLQILIDHGEITGVIYAPPGTTGTSRLDIDHGSLFGGAVLAHTTLFTDSSIHYDAALEGKQIVSRDAKVITITFLHISENEIEISG